MNVSILVQRHGLPPNDCLRDRLAKLLKESPCESVRVAVAYASVAGVMELFRAFPGGIPRRSKWLFGLDDFLTQPGAIDLVLNLENSEVRVATMGAENFRFHPKVYYFRFGVTPASEVLVVGSANLTRAAFTQNSEVSSILSVDNVNGSGVFGEIWDDLWIQGTPPTDALLRDYRDGYAVQRDLRTSTTPTSADDHTGLVTGEESAEADPTLAEVCWIECGSNTMRGRELEFKAEQALFFGLLPSGGVRAEFDFITSEGTCVRLAMKYQSNQMWRLQMNQGVPEVRHGLRRAQPSGSLARSELVAVFQRTTDPGVFHLSFLHEQSQEYVDLCSRSFAVGTLGRTTARRYGWY